MYLSIKTFSIVLLFGLVQLPRLQARVIHQEHSLYRNIIVTQNKNKRCMKFSFRRDRSQNQSCLLVNKKKKLVFDYAKLSTIGAVANPQAKKILIIGLGGGTLVKAYHDLMPQAQITTVEIDPAVVKVAKNYFYISPQPWSQIIAQDGRLFIKRALLKKQHFDIVVLDAFNGDYIPEHLMTREFFNEVKAILTEQGIVVSNTFSGSHLYNNESATYASVFGNFVELKGSFSGNRIILTTKTKPLQLKQLESNFVQYRQQMKDMDVKKSYLFNALNFEPEWNKKARILTDNYAPVNILD